MQANSRKQELVLIEVLARETQQIKSIEMKSKLMAIQEIQQEALGAMQAKDEQIELVQMDLNAAKEQNEQLWQILSDKNDTILKSIKTVCMLSLQPQNENVDYSFCFPSEPEHFSTLLKMTSFKLNRITFQQSVEDWQKIAFKLHFDEQVVCYGNQEKQWGELNLMRSVRAVEISEYQKLYGNIYREIYFYDANNQRIDGLNIYVSGFTMSFTGQIVQIPESYELIGVAYACDQDEHPVWLNFNIWQPPNVFDPFSEKVAAMRTE